MDAEAEGIHPQSNPDGLTNKERRLQKKAEKKRKLEDSTISKDDSQSSLDRKHKASSSSRNVGVAQDSLYDPENNDTSDTTPTTEKDGDNEEEVEAISHKERRKRRRMEKQSKREHSEETSVDGPRLQEQEKKEQRRSQYSLWIGNLSFNTSPQRLQEWLEENSIDGISRIHMPKGARKTEYNRGFAYVDVPSVEMMEAGVALSEGHLNGRKLLIKSGTDFSGRPRIDAAAKALASGEQVKDADEDAEGSTLIGPDGKRGKTGLTKTAQKILRAQKHPAGPTLFVGNLSFNATEDGLREMIERAAQARNDTEDKGAKQKEKMAGNVSFEEGDHPSRDFAVDGERREMNNKAATRTGAGIRKVRMGEFEDSGKCKGFAFVDFFTALQATATLIDPRNSHLDGRQLILQYAGADAIRRGASKGRASDRTQGFSASKESTREDEKIADKASYASSTAPEPGSFDADKILAKRHKETKEERQRRRESGISHNKRVRPGAALANAQRGRVSIALDAPQGEKKTFD